MRWLVISLLCVGWCSPAFAGVQFCNKFERPVHFSVAHQTPQGWVTEGWFSADPQACVAPKGLADLTNFLWSAETGPYMRDGKEVKTTWGKGKNFAVKDFKDSPFTVNKADRRQNGTRINPFTGPVSFTLPAIVATVTIEADSTSTTTIPGPNSVLKSDPDFKACEESSGDAAIAACDRAIASGKFQGDLLSQLHNNRGVEYKTKKDIDRALADFSEAIKLNPKNLLAYNNRGNTLLDKNDYDAAIADYNAAIAVDPKYLNAYSGLGDTYKNKKDYDLAIDNYRKALSLNPNEQKRKVIERILAGVYVDRGVTQTDPGAELADYEEALKLNPENTSALNNRAVLYSAKGEYDKAIQDLDQAITLKPDFALAFRNRGDAYRGKGDTEHAVADYKQALALNPSEEQKKQIQAALDAIASGRSAPTSPPAPPEPSTSQPVSGSGEEK
jgi:tetratricopeptide (TPR) repeat protein